MFGWITECFITTGCPDGNVATVYKPSDDDFPQLVDEDGRPLSPEEIPVGPETPGIIRPEVCKRLTASFLCEV